jgi:hypothetical protein
VIHIVQSVELVPVEVTRFLLAFLSLFHIFCDVIVIVFLLLSAQQIGGNVFVIAFGLTVFLWQIVVLPAWQKLSFLFLILRWLV